MSEYLVINEEVSELKWLPCRCFPQIRAHAEWSVALECILNDYNTDKTNHVQHLQWTRSWWWDKVQSPKLCRWNKGFTFPFKNWQIRANVHKSYRLQFITIFLHTGLLLSIKRKLDFLFCDAVKRGDQTHYLCCNCRRCWILKSSRFHLRVVFFLILFFLILLLAVLLDLGSAERETEAVILFFFH